MNNWYQLGFSSSSLFSFSFFLFFLCRPKYLVWFLKKFFSIIWRRCFKYVLKCFLHTRNKEVRINKLLFRCNHQSQLIHVAHNVDTQALSYYRTIYVKPNWNITYMIQSFCKSISKFFLAFCRVNFKFCGLYVSVICDLNLCV